MGNLEDHLATQIAETREEILRVDGKASIILAGAGVVVGAILAGLITGSLDVNGTSGVVLVVAALAGASTAAGIVFTAVAVYPRWGTPEPGRARYFTEAAQYDSIDELKEAVVKDLDYGDRLLYQLHRLSKSVTFKYQLARNGMLAFGAATAFGVLAAVLNILLD